MSSPAQLPTPRKSLALSHSARSARLSLVRCALVTLSLIGCHAPHPATAKGKVADQDRGQHDSDHPSLTTSREAPGPAPPNKAPTTNKVVTPWLKTQHGLQLCIKERIDLAQVFIKFDLNAYLPPEERLLLRAWLNKTFETAVEQGLLTQFRSDRVPTDICAEGLFCAWLNPNDGERGAKLLADFLKTPTLSTFYAAHESARDTADELYERSTIFRFGALVESFVEGRATHPGTDPSKPKTLDRLLGSSRIAQINAATLGQTLRRHIKTSELTIFTPLDTKKLTQYFIDQLALPSGPTAAPHPALFPDVPLEIVDDRFPESTLYLTWPQLESSERTVRLQVLQQLANEFQAERPSAYVRVHHGNGLVFRPALLITAAHELLVQSAASLNARAKTLMTKKMLNASALAPNVAEQDCGSTPPKGSSDPSEAGTLMIAIWGAKLPPKSEESF